MVSSIPHSVTVFLTLLACHSGAVGFGGPNSDDEGLKICYVDTYDYRNLTIPQSWTFDFAGFCLSTQQHSLQCSFTFSLCEPLNLGAGCQDASVCQTDLVGGGSTQKNMTEIGDYNPAVNPLFKSINGPDGFNAQYTGPAYKDSHNNTHNVSVLMAFECDKRVDWTADPGDSLVSVPDLALDRVEWDDSIFQYSIYMKYSGACLTDLPSQDIVQPSTALLSGGTILIIIVLCSVSAYCIIGVTAKAVKGSKGVEVIPNIDLWRSVPGYTADGVRACCGFVTCKKPKQGLPKLGGYDSI